ncbi:MAG: hypothetical protein H6888_03115 [Nitratireductor sp.]|nr:hypothetical protein [Nitratireductor sp.]MCC0020046.1 hypothetical protein [Nitratireductor sp.]
MSDNEKVTVVRSGSGAGWFVAAILLIALAAGAYYVVNGGFTNEKSVSIELKVPDGK